MGELPAHRDVGLRGDAAAFGAPRRRVRRAVSADPPLRALRGGGDDGRTGHARARAHECASPDRSRDTATDAPTDPDDAAPVGEAGRVASRDPHTDTDPDRPRARLDAHLGRYRSSAIARRPGRGLATCSIRSSAWFRETWVST